MKQFTVAIAGLGGRGYHTYAKYRHLHPERMKIVAIADVDREKVELCGEEFSVPRSGRFLSAESMLAREKLADVMIIATQDYQHKKHAIAALERGYDLLLEKPVAMTPEDCEEIECAAVKANRMVVVCHVLRYTTFFRTVKEIIDSGKIGQVQSLQATENVGYWHQAHSFVRGNWRSDLLETPMIVQKCCHDFDMIAWLIGKPCISVSSYGALSYFTAENAPANSSDRCCSCRAREDCPYDAHKIYFDNRDIGFIGAGNTGWPCDILAENPTAEKLEEALRTGPYGKCVFRCDNTVVDHQVTNMLFEGGITASLTMTGFTAKNFREYKVFGTLGEIVADQESNTVTLTPFGEPSVVYDINRLADDLSGHGGGDNRMLDEMFEALERGGEVTSSIRTSVRTHMMAFAAEKSRLEGGRVVPVSEEYGNGYQEEETSRVAIVG